MPSPHEMNLYERLGLRDFATSSEIAARLPALENNSDTDINEAKEILSNHIMKGFYDTIWEAWKQPDKILPRYTSRDAAEETMELASRIGFTLKEVSKNTFRVTIVIDESQLREQTYSDCDGLVIIGNREFELQPLAFVADINRFSGDIVLEADSEYSNWIKVIMDSIVQQRTRQGDQGTLFLLYDRDSTSLGIHAALFNQTQQLFSPLASGNHYLFGEGRVETAIKFKIRASTERIRQLIHGYHQDLAKLVVKIDPRIDEQVAVESCQRYHQRWYT